jgi:hypothetical protein
VVKNGTYTTSCAPGGTPSQVTYTVAAGAYSSTIGQADADAKAQNDVNANGQNYANTHGTCTFYSAAQAGNFTRNNCAAGGSPSTVPYSIAAGAYTSLISQADANQQAVNALNTLGQNNANANGTCTFYNAYLIQSFTRNNCSPGQIGGTMTYSVPAGKYSSTISQADADAKAHNDMNTNGQTVVNNNASCTQPTIYAKMFYENGHPSPDGYVADIVVRFFSDANYTQPMYVYDLTVNWAIDGHCEWEHFNTFSDQATGYSLYLRTQYPINYPDPDSQEGSGYMCNDVYLLQAGNYVYL